MKIILAIVVAILALWLILGLLWDFKSAATAIVIGCTYIAVIFVWAKFVIDNKLW